MPKLHMPLPILFGLFLFCATLRPAAAAEGSSLHFFGGGSGDVDRVKIPLGSIDDGQLRASLPVNVADAFTIEFWMQATPGANNAAACADNGWYYGNIIIDRDVDGAGDYGDYGVALCDQRIAFGVAVGETEGMVFGATPVTDGAWHHIAVTRAAGGNLAIFVDGRLDGQAPGPAGQIDYRTNRPTDQPNSDPYLVLGAEKHDYEGSAYYHGRLDDLHIANQVRYTSDFVRPSGPHQPDGATVALYRFDEGSGVIVNDSSGAPGGPSHGMLMLGGPANGPLWSDEHPFRADETAALEQDLSSEGAPEDAVPNELETSVVITPTPFPPLEASTPVPPEPLPLSPTAEVVVNPTSTPVNLPAALSSAPPPDAASGQPILVALVITLLGLGTIVGGILIWHRRKR
ncbi:MAG: LamG domain-containing protein [Candidatus Viridilinea halotolerans]|uniref:LamG domain-containing protein n=1 Tax=Candidatus Viridilinea halotolerans TaxID=2491704 RepID=A0A426TQS1_9CHLR|nr:MAG: LamG domain-containing protein [Candidatus Viridilinea halotolerans]